MSNFKLNKNSFKITWNFFLKKIFWNSGGEDDDLSHRLKKNSLHIIRPPEEIGRYEQIQWIYNLEISKTP